MTNCVKRIVILIDIFIIFAILLFPIIVFSIYTDIGFYHIDKLILSDNRVESILFTETKGDMLKNEYKSVHLKLKDGTKLILSDVKLKNKEVYYSTLRRLNDYGCLWKFYYDKDVDYLYLWATDFFYANKANQKITNEYLLTSLIDNIDDIKAYYASLPVASDEFSYYISEGKYESAGKLMGFDLYHEENPTWHYFLRLPSQYDEWRTKN